MLRLGERSLQPEEGRAVTDSAVVLLRGARSAVP